MRTFRTSNTKPVAVITGGAGFLGSHLADRLLKGGYRVMALDNLITGSPHNIAHLEGNEDFLFQEQDVSEPWTVEGDLSVIFHMASPASPFDYLDHPLETLRVGSYGTHNALEVARTKGARFLVASTSEIYGDPLQHPQREDYFGNVNTIGPRSVYDEAKRYAEAVTMCYHRLHGVDTKIVRIFNTYGPRMRLRDGRVVPAFIGQALNDEPLTVFGDGSQTRSFCYVSDLIEGIFRLSESAENLPVNIGNPCETTILEFAEEIRRLVNPSAPIQFENLPVDDPKVRKPDITKAKELLGWEPQVVLQDGLAETISYFRGVLNRRD